MAGGLYALVVWIIGVITIIGVGFGIDDRTPITGSIVTGGLRLCLRLVAGLRGRVASRRVAGQGESGAGGRVAGPGCESSGCGARRERGRGTGCARRGELRNEIGVRIMRLKLIWVPA